MDFSEFLSGKSSRQIACDLNEKGILSKQGRAWKAAAITGMLRNEKYQGDLLLGKTYTDSEFNRHKNYGERDMYYISDHHEPIIDRTTLKQQKESWSSIERKRISAREKRLQGMRFQERLYAENAKANGNARQEIQGRATPAACISRIKRNAASYR